MGRMYSKGKGISSTTVPYRKYSCEWKGLTSQNLIKIVSNLARNNNLPPSKIGLILRDEKLVVDTKNISGMNISKILRLKGLVPIIPEDLFYLIKKANKIKEHLIEYNHDLNSIFHLNLIESHIYRLSRYYKRIYRLPKNWKYISDNIKNEFKKKKKEIITQKMKRPDT
mmetsp:Transcript_27655/g.38618  ORF Transcript_27655/g.38618 Transcript_27655/m.38618 type:complete len:169 (+) Transcript_27655:765-1271(+)